MGSSGSAEEKAWGVFSSVGLALHNAQILEDRLRTFCGDRQSPILVWPEYHKAFAKGEIATDTLGGLVARARALVAEDDPLVENFTEVVGLRNYLVHHFFDSHRRTALGPKKHQLMMNEAGTIAVRFQVLAELIDQRIAERTTLAP